jgi:GLPGLI family protein
MIKNVVILSLLLIGFLSNAQAFQGKAEYFSKRIHHRKVADANSKKEIDPEFEKEIEAAFKKATEKKFVLTFNKVEALYEEEEELEKPKVTGETTISISFGGAGKKYINIKEKKTIVEEELYGKQFLINEPIVENPDWKLIDETKKIGDYTCHKAEIVIAVTEREKQAYKTYLEKTAKKQKSNLFGGIEEPKDKVVTAWYTPEIPVNLGPSNYWGLPGLILEVNEEKVVLLCSKVTLNNKSTFKIKPPTAGKSVTQNEFNAIEKKKTKQLMGDDGVITFSSTTEE